LPNGLTVATEENPSAGAATVGVWIDAGSRTESAKTNGAANLLEHIAIQVMNPIHLLYTFTLLFGDLVEYLWIEEHYWKY
jgi:hypothetical protein